MSGSQVSLLPEKLRRLVKRSVAQLGEVIEHEAGRATFLRIEKIRKEMASLRGLPQSQVAQILDETLKKFKSYSPEQIRHITHSFTLMLELINACENAYRSYRLNQYPKKVYPKSPAAMIYVVTAHPTEARSPANIAIFHEIQKTLTRLLDVESQSDLNQLKNQLELAWHILTNRARRPRVQDEADHIYSLLLRDETLDALLACKSEFGPIYIRSWVGGDKDGHPGVNEVTLRESLNLSRKRLLSYFEKNLVIFNQDLKLLQNLDKTLVQALQRLRGTIFRLRVIRRGDGKTIRTLQSQLSQLSEVYERIFGVQHQILIKIQSLLQIFPALVVPLELREHSGTIRLGADGKRTVIGRMLHELELISRGGDPRFYARGLILSMAQSFRDLQAGVKIVRKYLGGNKIPVIPLFEQEAALRDAPMILEQMLKDLAFRRIIDRDWQGNLEVMLGYSDSAKELGVFASHLTILKTIKRLDSLCRSHSITPVFFHGSGGSTDRGGGSIEEQTDGWPKSALNVYKATIQGETVERTFASPEITRRRFEQIVSKFNQTPLKAHSGSHSVQTRKAVQKFGQCVSEAYQNKVKSQKFLDMVYCTTSYRYLNVLRIGSRPTNRGGALNFSDLRTIPWVLCWTQTRVLFPTWWGVGHFWSETRKKPEAQSMIQVFRQALQEVPAFRSYFKILSSTLARVDLSIWRLYLENSDLPSGEAASVLNEFINEYQLAVDFVRQVSNERNLLWFRPWFGVSVQLRSPMIHPLNLIQLIAIKKGDHQLLRETVTGIASGMMTTG